MGALPPARRTNKAEGPNGSGVPPEPDCPVHAARVPRVAVVRVSVSPCGDARPNAGWRSARRSISRTLRARIYRSAAFERIGLVRHHDWSEGDRPIRTFAEMNVTTSYLQNDRSLPLAFGDSAALWRRHCRRSARRSHDRQCRSVMKFLRNSTRARTRHGWRRMGPSGAGECGSQSEMFFLGVLFGAPWANEDEAHDENIETRHWKRRCRRNPGDVGQRAVAFLADAPRARSAGDGPRNATTKGVAASRARAPRADARANRALS
jgi:hypothetical protein